MTEDNRSHQRHVPARPPVPEPCYTLIGTQFSYYTAKLRAYLIHKGLPFQELLPSGNIYADVIIPRTGAAMIPVLVSPDGNHVWGDTKCITDMLEAECQGPWMRPDLDRPRQRFVTDLLEMYADEWLVMTALHYRWNIAEQRKYLEWEFGRSTGKTGSEDETIARGKKLTERFQAYLPVVGVTPATMSPIASQTRQLLGDLRSHLENHEYILGDRATMADFAIIGPLYGHLLIDPATAHFVRIHSPSVANYVERAAGYLPSEGGRDRPVGLTVDKTSGRITIQYAIKEHDVLPDDQVPATLLPLLDPIFRDMLPYLLDATAEVRNWLDQNPSTVELPRSVGVTKFRLWNDQVGEWVEEERQCLTHTVWMAKRMINSFNGMTKQGQQSVIDLIQSIPKQMAWQNDDYVSGFLKLREGVDACAIKAKGALVVRDTSGPRLHL
ncbi:hypothetical protein DFS34DRAFT_154522 [Phlyctochytrium arcticum]|nr:hypothetical protein DFS34DRAFT_154522 [Phlyctochytrium arcticum]